MKKVLAYDFGASSGRAMLVTLKDGKVNMEEIHRFSNDPVTVNGRMYWDVLRLFFEIKSGITKAVNMGGFDAVSIDTWGVDFGLIDKNGNLLANPFHYRDNRTDNIPEKVFKDYISKEELYKRAGLQLIHFNTIYQLMYLKYYEPETLARAEKMLMMPDLFAYMLTGEIHEEASIASTSNLLNPVTKDWDFELIDKLGLERRIFAPMLKPGSEYGKLSDAICEELGCDKVPVIAVAGHDTASAVAATPSISDDFVYISCGTWSLFGIESKTPILTDDAMNADFTNEGGFEDTTRFLKNIMGLWLIQESRRQWKREGDDVGFDVLEKEALAAKPFKCFINVDDKSFEASGNLPKRVCEYCEKTGQYVPKNRGEIMRCIYESLALKYKHTFNVLSELSNRKYNRINVLGGGIKDTLLCKLTANACGVEVLAGPAEATAMGNATVALYSLGELKDFKQMRQAVINSTDIKTYLPENTEEFEKAYKKYLEVTGL